MTAADILRAAKERIATEATWCKGRRVQYVDGVAKFCANQAVVIATEGNASYEVSLLNRAARELSDRKFRTSMAFNDDPRTTHADILALFDRAIAMAEAT